MKGAGHPRPPAARQGASRPPRLHLPKATARAGSSSLQASTTPGGAAPTQPSRTRLLTLATFVRNCRPPPSLNPKFPKPNPKWEELGPQGAAVPDLAGGIDQ